MKQGLSSFLSLFLFFSFLHFISRLNLVLNVLFVSLILRKINKKKNIVKERSKISNVICVVYCNVFVIL